MCLMLVASPLLSESSLACRTEVTKVWHGHGNGPSASGNGLEPEEVFKVRRKTFVLCGDRERVQNDSKLRNLRGDQISAGEEGDSANFAVICPSWTQ